MCAGYLSFQQQLFENKDYHALSARTLKDYKYHFHVLNKVFGAMAPADFDSAHKMDYLSRARLEKRSVSANREMSALGSAFKFGMEKRLVRNNPCHGVSKNPERPRTRKVELTEFNAFLAHAKAKGGSAYMVALIGSMVALTGRRRGELLALPRTAVTDLGIAVRDNKTKPNEDERFYLIEWSPTLRQVMTEIAGIKRRHDRTQSFLFPTNDGRPYTDSGFTGLWRRLMVDYAGDKSSPKWFHAHDLRALYVSEMLEQKRAPNTHRNAQTMESVYNRRKVIKVAPLA
jgi:integrase